MNLLGSTYHFDCSSADVEAEDVDLGDERQDDLVSDVDADVDESDREALDSDGEQSMYKELGLISDEMDGWFLPSYMTFFVVFNLAHSSTNAHHSPILPFI